MRKNSCRSLVFSLLLALAIPASAQEIVTIGDAVYASRHLPEASVDGTIKLVVDLPDGISTMGVDVPAPAVELTSLPGDVNFDGRTDIADSVRILRIAVGLETLDDERGQMVRSVADIAPHFEIADPLGGITRFRANGNGVVDIGDAVASLREAVGLEINIWPERTVMISENMEAPLVLQGFSILLGMSEYLRPNGGMWENQRGGLEVSGLNAWSTSYAVLFTGDAEISGELAWFSWKGPRTIPWVHVEYADSSAVTYVLDWCSVSVTIYSPDEVFTMMSCDGGKG